MKTLMISLPDDVYDALQAVCALRRVPPEDVAAKIIVQSYQEDDCRGEIRRLREDVAALAQLTLVLSKITTPEAAARWVEEQMRQHR